jgi:hypothetical protein
VSGFKTSRTPVAFFSSRPCTDQVLDEPFELCPSNGLPQGLDWSSLLGLKGEALEAHYIAILNRLGRGDDTGSGLVRGSRADNQPGTCQAI